MSSLILSITGWESIIAFAYLWSMFLAGEALARLLEDFLS